MSLHLEFEPHSWYMGFAIKKNYDHQKWVNATVRTPAGYIAPEDNKWSAYTDNGMTCYIDERHADTLAELKSQIREYHLGKHTLCGERIARRRLEELRDALHAENISYAELSDISSLYEYIGDDDVELLEAAGVPEGKR